MDVANFHLRPTRDHVIPRSRGGREKVICCWKCNSLKGDMMPDEWAAYMAANPGWWLLTRAQRKHSRRIAARKRGVPNKQGHKIMPVVVPPELIWRTRDESSPS
jgi:hypothetical protein